MQNTPWNTQKDTQRSDTSEKLAVLPVHTIGTLRSNNDNVRENFAEK